MTNIDLLDACLCEAQRRNSSKPMTPEQLINGYYSDAIHCPQECKPGFYNGVNFLLGEEGARIVMQEIVALDCKQKDKQPKPQLVDIKEYWK